MMNGRGGKMISMAYAGQRIPENLLITGPSHTGKTTRAIDYCFALTKTRYSEQNRAGKLARLVEEGRVIFTVFHRNMGYGEFIEREYRAGNRAVVRDGVLKKICATAAAEEKKSREEKKPARKFVLVIRNCLDTVEDIMKVWGGVFSLLRGETQEVELPYSHMMLSIPGNLHIIFILDFAVSDGAGQTEEGKYFFDTFRIERMKVKYSMIKNISTDCSRMIKKINKKIKGRQYIDGMFRIGHGYFANAKTADDIIRILQKRVFPLFLLGDIQWSNFCEFGLGGCADPYVGKDTGEAFLVRHGGGFYTLSEKAGLSTVKYFLDRK